MVSKLPRFNCGMLFNLATGISEQHGLSAEKPGKLAESKKLYEAGSVEVDAGCRKLGLEPKGVKAPRKTNQETCP